MMSTSSSRVPAGYVASAKRSRVGPSLRAYFFADGTRAAQTVLGLIWLLDGGLQFQSFMYSRGFIQMLTAMAPASRTGWPLASTGEPTSPPATSASTTRPSR